MQDNKINHWLILGLLSIIWGSSYILMKVGLLAFTPLQLALIRIIISGLAMLPFLLRHFRGTSLAVWGWCLLLGLIGSLLPFICFALAQSVISSSLAGMLNSLQPLFTLTIGILIFKQRLPNQQIIGVVIGFAGASVLLGTRSAVASFGDNFLFSLLVVLATFCYGIAANIIRHYLYEVSPVKITALSLGVLILPASVILWFTDIHVQFQTNEQVMNSFYAIAALGTFGTAFAIILYNKLIKEAGMMVASSVAYLIPIVAIIWGVLDGEAVYMSHIFGISVIFIGLYLINQRREKTTEPVKQALQTD